MFCTLPAPTFLPATLFIVENSVKNANVGDPLVAFSSSPDYQVMFQILRTYATNHRTIPNFNETLLRDNSQFWIDACSGQVKLRTGGVDVINFEAIYTYTITVRTFVSGFDNAETIRNVTISVIDANDAPVFDVSSLSVTLPENSLEGATVSAMITVSDQDTYGGVVSWFNQTYEILNGNTDGIFDVTTSYLTPSATQPNGATIFVKLGGPELLNFEDRNRGYFQLFILARDGGGKSTQGIVTITLTDVNEAPFFANSETLTRNIDETCSSFCVTLSSELPVGPPIAASDPDVFWSPAQNISFSILSGASGYFSIDSSTGQLQLTASGA